jgi:puromycin-sensitive aminopeptidase
VDRMGVISDLFAVSSMTLCPESYPLELLTAYLNEDNYSVWTDICGHLKAAHARCIGECYEHVLTDYLRRSLGPIYQKLGWQPKPTDTTSTVSLRAVVLGLLAALGDADVVATCIRLVTEASSTIPPDYRTFVYQTYVAHGGAEAFDHMLALFRSSPVGEDKRVALQVSSVRTSVSPCLADTTTDVFSLVDLVIHLSDTYGTCV